MTDNAHLTFETIFSRVAAELAAVEKEHPSGQSPSANRRRLNAFRDVRRTNLERIENAFDQGASGKVTAELLTAYSDAFVVHAFRSGFSEGTGLTLCALGGYGRREMNPFSDIDILCLVPEDTGTALEPAVSAMIQFLWDMNFDVGHSTRTIAESVAVAETDADFATSLLEARIIAGDDSRWNEMRDSFTEWRQGENGKRLARKKIGERKQRLDYFHNTVQIQEPNIKDSPGALRDIHVIRWLAELTGGGIGRFCDTGCITRGELETLEGDLDFYLRIRHALHFLSGRKADILDHLILPDAAVKAGYRGQGNMPVEAMMHDYYMRAGRIKRISDRVSACVRDELEETASCEFVYAGDNILISDKGVGLPGAASGVFREHPWLLVRLCAVAGSRGLPLTGELSSAIEAYLETADNATLQNGSTAEAFRELFNMNSGIAAALRLMHAHGILTRIVPEFDEISWHYQFDFYHTYTTDEHSIRVVENLERLVHGGDESMAWLTDLAGEVTAKAALYIAGLLHDVGKKTGRGHAKAGEKMAAQALKRLGCDTRTIKLVRFLIAEHLIMSHISQRRDIDDEDTVRDFIDRTGSTGRLRLLTLLTFADLMALSDSALTDWKKSLLRSLYNKSLILLEKGFEEHAAMYRKNRIDAIIGTLTQDLPEDAVTKHLGLLPEQYIRVTSRKSIREHIRGVDRMRRAGAWASFRRKGDYSLLTVITPDYPHALSDICGTITSSGINIIGARIFTRDDGIIIDTFLVTDREGDPLIADDSQREFKNNLLDVVLRNTEVTHLLSDYHRRWRRRKQNVVYSPPRITVHNDVSSKYTVVDIFAIDYTGLLYDITSVFASLDIDIHTARIGTDEDQVADAFYIQHSGGGKIVGSAALEKLKLAVINKLNAAYKAGQ